MDTIRNVKSKKRKVSILLVLLQVTLVCSTITFLHINKSPEASVDFWSSRINNCMDKFVERDEIAKRQSSDCMESILYGAVSNKSVKNFAIAANAVIGEEYNKKMQCHVNAHDIGPKIVDLYKSDWSKLIELTGYSFCENGLIHGVFDIFAGSSPKKADWISVGGMCNKLFQRIPPGCSDAVGHAAYESSGQNRITGLEICNLMPEGRMQIDCAMGVYMAGPFPTATQLKSDRGIEIIPEDQWVDWVKQCDLQQLKKSTKTGCYLGAGWVIGQSIQVTNESNSIDMHVPDKSADKISYNSYKTAFYACEEGDSIESDLLMCKRAMLSRLPTSAYANLQRYKGYCSKATEGRPVFDYNLCLIAGQQTKIKWLRTLINENSELRNVIERFYDSPTP
jgi:hypothetical protein